MTFGWVTVTDQNITPETLDEKQAKGKFVRMCTGIPIFDKQLLMKSFAINVKPKASLTYVKTLLK